MTETVIKVKKFQDTAVRGRIATIVNSIWFIVPAIAAIAWIIGGLQLLDLKDFLAIWHNWSTWVATLISGYYFGSP